MEGLAAVGRKLGGMRLAEHLERGNSALRNGSFDGSELPSENADRAWSLEAVSGSRGVGDTSEVSCSSEAS
jgi:hypothetical protein